MNRYDERYLFRIASRSDIAAIMEFLDKNWEKNHILSKDRKLFEYEFLEDNTVNIMLAIDRNKGTIEALTGFLNCSHTVDVEKRYVWGSFWKVNDSINNMTFLGVELMKRLIDLLHCKGHLGIGINPKTSLPLRNKLFKDKVAKMNHYYILNDEVSEYKIAVIKNHYRTLVDDKRSNVNIVPCSRIEDVRSLFSINNHDAIPYKDYWYINKRYFNHPYYDYQVYSIRNEIKNKEALLVTRDVCHSACKALRIVDYLGDPHLLSECTRFLIKLLKENAYEYVDFYNWGIDSNIVISAGFILKKEDDENIIPNYFEPFEQKNVDIWVRYKEEGTVFCKADGDQDRPNMLV